MATTNSFNLSTIFTRKAIGLDNLSVNVSVYFKHYFYLNIFACKHSGNVLLSCLVLSCLVLSCLVLSCLVLSCLVLSCLVLSCLVLSCLVCILANTPGGVKRSGLGAHACWVIIYVSKLV